MDTPTPAPTSTVVLWPTPTPMPTTASTPVMDFGGSEMAYTVAENLVQGYQQANQMGALNMLMFAIILFIVLGGIWSIMRHIKSL